MSQQSDIQSQKRIREAADLLIEHFDSIVIVGTLSDEEGTCLFSARRGNSYAARDSAREWLGDQITERKVQVEQESKGET